MFSSVITIYHESTPQYPNLKSQNEIRKVYTPFITNLNLRELEKSSSDCNFYCPVKKQNNQIA